MTDDQNEKDIKSVCGAVLNDRYHDSYEGRRCDFCDNSQRTRVLSHTPNCPVYAAERIMNITRDDEVQELREVVYEQHQYILRIISKAKS